MVRGRAPVAVVEEIEEELGDAHEEAVRKEHVGHCDHLSRDREQESALVKPGICCYHP
jgi:hypothetical protein